MSLSPEPERRARRRADGGPPAKAAPYRIASSTVWQILKTNGIDPAPRRSEVTWSKFLHSLAAVACDFFTIDTALWPRSLGRRPLRDEAFPLLLTIPSCAARSPCRRSRRDPAHQ